jgi:hypothetical protein
MSRVRSAPLILAAVTIAAAAGGCGSGKKQVSAAELVQKADVICRTERTKFTQIQAHPPESAAIAADQTKELIGVADAATSELRDLDPPDSLSGAYDAYLDSRDAAADQMRRGQDAAENRDSAGYSAAQTAVAKNAPRRKKLAAAVGLKVCGTSPGRG